MNISLKAKLSLIIILFNILLISFLTFNVNKDIKSRVESNLSIRLKHIAATASVGLSKKNYKKLYKEFRKNGKKAVESKAFTRVAKYLKSVKFSNNLSSDVYIAFIPSWDKKKMIFLAMSSKVPYLGNQVNVTPIVQKVYKTKTPQLSEVYKTDQGEWISGVAPIISNEKVIGFIQADFSTKEEVSQAIDHAFRTVIMPLVTVLIILSIILIFIVNKIMSSLTKNIQRNISELSAGTQLLSVSCKNTEEFSESINEMNKKHLVSLESASSSLEEINAMATKASKNTDHAVDIAGKAVNKANKGKETINNMLGSIKVVSKTNEKVTSRMSRIRSEISEITEVISKISDKTSIINDIVFQTKLLSFNASVEAARAGEHGKGFSVLAQEIGNLASLSGKSSEEITEILQSGTETVNEIIKNTEKDMKDLVAEASFNIQQAVDVGEQCEESMQEIFENINTVITMMNEIHHATREQAEGISLANESVIVLSGQSGKYKQVSRKSQEIAEQLSIQIVGLKRVVSFLEQTASGEKKKEA